MADELTDEELTDQEAAAPPTADELADQGLDAPVVAEPVVEPQPEPVVQGHSVVQDNVSEPGVQHTKTPEGEVTSSAVTVPEPEVKPEGEATDAA